MWHIEFYAEGAGEWRKSEWDTPRGFVTEEDAHIALTKARGPGWQTKKYRFVNADGVSEPGTVPDVRVTAQPWYSILKPEPIEVMEAWNHLPLTRQLALKYLARAGLKGDKAAHIKDLEKAIAYLTRERNLVRDGKATW